MKQSLVNIINSNDFNETFDWEVRHFVITHFKWQFHFIRALQELIEHGNTQAIQW